MRRLSTNEQRASSIGHRATILLSLFLLAAVSATAQTGVIETFAGGGPNNLPALEANLQRPVEVAVDGAGNFYIAAADQHRVFKVDTSGQLTVVAGNGTPGSSGDGGPATGASLNFPRGVAVDAAGNLFIASGSLRVSVGGRIRRVDAATGIITTVAGNGVAGFSGDGGPATGASLSENTGVAVDAAGNFFIADIGNHRIRRVDAATGIITTVAGNGVAGFSGDGGPATSASLFFPFGVAVDAAGNLFIAEGGFPRRIRRVDAATGIITSPFVFTSFSRTVNGVAVDASGFPFFSSVSDFRGSFTNFIIRLNPATLFDFRVAGTGVAGFSGDGGPATSATLNRPAGVAVDANGNLFIADRGNQRIRRVDAGADGQLTGAPDEVITTVAGNGLFGFSGDGGPATSASLSGPTGVAVDAAGNLFIADQFNNRIRRVDAATGIITTVAGNGLFGFSGDGGPATSARLANPSGVAAGGGALFIADEFNQRIRRVIHAVNQPPVADAGLDQRVECTSPGTTSVTLDGSGSSDPDGDPLTFEWKDASANLVGTTPTVALTLPVGSHTFTLTVSDGKGGTASDSVMVTVQDATPPVLSLSQTTVTAVIPTASATGAAVDLSGIASATDACDPAPVITHNAPAEFPIGLTTVTFTATDASGNFSQKQLNVHVVYNFIGFLPPINNDGSSIFKFGRIIPIKFQLTAADGSAVTNAVATLNVFKITDAILGTVEEITPEASGASNIDNLFRFSAPNYVYNLNTTGYSSGTYLLRASLNDQSMHEVPVSVR